MHRGSRIAPWWCLVVLIAVTLAHTAPPFTPRPDQESAALRGVGRVLQWSDPLEPPDELRRILFLCGIGPALLLSGIVRFARRASSQDERSTATAVPFVYHALVGFVVYWGFLSWLLKVTDMPVAVPSASLVCPGLGWLALFAAGWAWSSWLAGRLDPRGHDVLARGVFVLATVSALLALWFWQAQRLKEPGWPVGTVTAVGFVAAIWTSWALPSVVLLKSHPRTGVLSIVALVASGVLLVVSARRGAILATGAAICATAVLWAFASRWRTARIGLLSRSAAVALTVGFAAFAVYHVQRELVTQAKRSGSISARLDIWRATAAAARERPFFGFGPEGFFGEINTRFAPGRSVLPALQPRDLISAAHNEWLQAIMELGAPGGAAYLLLPLLALLRAWRRFSATDDVETRVRIAGLFAALIALMAGEASSVMMRGVIGPPWYWTVIGLLLAATSRAASARTSILPVRVPPGALCAAAGIGLLALAAVDRQASRARAAGLAEMRDDPAAAVTQLERARFRLSAIDTVHVMRDIALARSTMGDDPDAAIRAWREMLALCPGYPEGAGRLADTIWQAGRRYEAVDVANEVVDVLAPYDRLSNLILARASADLNESMEFLARAIRNGTIEGEADGVLLGLHDRLDFSESWGARVAAVRACYAEQEDPPLCADALGVEVTRIETWRLAQRGDYASARQTARLAVRIDGLLGGTPEQRDHPARAEAWLMLARAIWLEDHGNHAAAYRAVRQGLQYFIPSGPHVVLRREPGDREVLSRLMPTAFLEEHRTTWALSALLHLAAGETRHLSLQVYGALPSGQRTPLNVQRMIGNLARQLHEAFAPLAPERRPPHYDTLLPLARSSEAR
jgi:O-antigen ligase